MVAARRLLDSQPPLSSQPPHCTGWDKFVWTPERLFGPSWMHSLGSLGSAILLIGVQQTRQPVCNLIDHAATYIGLSILERVSLASHGPVAPD